MNLTLERAPALAALSRVVGVVERKQTIPILGNVALYAAEGSLQVRATDLDMEAIERVPCEISTPGEITVEASKLYDIVRNSETGAQVCLALNDDDPRMKVRSGRSNFKVPCLSADLFPTFNAEDLGPEFKMPAKLLADMLARTAWAAIASDKTSVKGCVYLHTREGQIRSVATDGNVIAIRREVHPPGIDLDCILTAKLANHLARWLADAEGDVSIASSASLIRLRHGEAQITSKLWDGQFFAYERVVSESHENTAAIDRDALVAAIRRVAIMADGNVRVVRMAFAPGSVTLTTKGGMEGSEGAEEISCDYDGEPITITMNAVQTAAILDAMRGELVEFGFDAAREGAHKSSLVIVKGADDAGLLCNLMQMRA